MLLASFTPRPHSPDANDALKALVRLLAQQAARENLTSKLKEKDVDHEDEDVAQATAEANDHDHDRAE